jgi:hypothetical protein
VSHYSLHLYPISKVLVDVLSLVINVCVMNQFKGHWLLIDVLFTTITMNCKFKKKIETNLFLDNSMEDDVVVAIELNLLTSNIQR